MDGYDKLAKAGESFLGPRKQMVTELYCFRLVHPSVRDRPLLYSSNVVFLIGFLSNFIYGLLPSNSSSSSNMGFECDLIMLILITPDMWQSKTLILHVSRNVD